MAFFLRYHGKFFGHSIENLIFSPFFITFNNKFGRTQEQGHLKHQTYYNSVVSGPTKLSIFESKNATAGTTEMPSGLFIQVQRLRSEADRRAVTEYTIAENYLNFNLTIGYAELPLCAPNFGCGGTWALASQRITVRRTRNCRPTIALVPTSARRGTWSRQALKVPFGRCRRTSYPAPRNSSTSVSSKIQLKFNDSIER